MARGKYHPNVKSWADVKRNNPISPFDPSSYHYKILAEGDSWFTIGGIPMSNFLYSYRFKRSTLIVNCATPGDTIKKMKDMKNNREFREALCLTGKKLKYNLILLSAGGNDLIDDSSKYIKKITEKNSTVAKDYCDDKKLDKLLKNIQDGYRKICAVRDRNSSISKNVPVLVHTYDYPTARNAPAEFGLITIGPWLYKTYTEKSVPEKYWKDLTDYIFDKLAEAILDLKKGGDKISNFHVFDTRNTLKRAKPDPTDFTSDWLNEIHPNMDGYRKLAIKVNSKLDKLIL